MWLRSAASLLNKIANPICRALSGLGAGILAVMMFLTAMDVLLRYFFNSPISGSLELVQYMMAIVVASGLGYCAIEKAHVRVEIIIDRLPPKVQTILNSITSFCGLGLIVLITRQAVIYVQLLIDAKLTSPFLLIPTYPFVIILALGTAVFCLTLLAEFVYFLSKAMNK